MASAWHHVVGTIRSEVEPMGETGVKFSVPVDRKYTKKDGEKVEETTWYNCKAWGKTAELILEYCENGSNVELDLEFRLEEGDDGKKWVSWVVKPFGFSFGPKSGDGEPKKKLPF